MLAPPETVKRHELADGSLLPPWACRPPAGTWYVLHETTVPSKSIRSMVTVRVDVETFLGANEHGAGEARLDGRRVQDDGGGGRGRQQGDERQGLQDAHRRLLPQRAGSAIV